MLIAKGEQEIAASAQRLKEIVKPLKQHDMYREVEGSVPIGKESTNLSLAKVCIANSNFRAIYYADAKGIRAGRRGEDSDDVSLSVFMGHRSISPCCVPTARGSQEDDKRRAIGRIDGANVKKSTRLRKATLRWVNLRTHLKGVRNAFKQDVVASISGLAKHICDAASKEALLGVEASTVSIALITLNIVLPVSFLTCLKHFVLRIRSSLPTQTLKTWMMKNGLRWIRSNIARMDNRLRSRKIDTFL